MNTNNQARHADKLLAWRQRYGFIVDRSALALWLRFEYGHSRANAILSGMKKSGIIDFPMPLILAPITYKKIEWRRRQTEILIRATLIIAQTRGLLGKCEIGESSGISCKTSPDQ